VKNLKNSTIIEASKEIVSNMIDNEIVMMNPNKRLYIGLNRIGTEIWKSIQTETTIENLLRSILDKYDVPESKCEQETKKFILKLKDNGLVDLK
jgi:hypothetical protein